MRERFLHKVHARSMRDHRMDQGGSRIRDPHVQLNSDLGRQRVHSRSCSVVRSSRSRRDLVNSQTARSNASGRSTSARISGRSRCQLRTSTHPATAASRSTRPRPLPLTTPAAAAISHPFSRSRIMQDPRIMSDPAAAAAAAAATIVHKDIRPQPLHACSGQPQTSTHAWHAPLYFPAPPHAPRMSGRLRGTCRRAVAIGPGGVLRPRPLHAHASGRDRLRSHGCSCRSASRQREAWPSAYRWRQRRDAVIGWHAV